MSWQAFSGHLPVLFAGPPPAGDLEMVAVRKSVTWSGRDFNVYVGSAARQVRSFLDLGTDEFTRIFGWHLKVARVLSSMLDCDVHVIG